LQHLAGDVGHRNLERRAETGEPQAQVAQVRFTLVGLLFGCDVFSDELRHGAGFSDSIVAPRKIGGDFAE